MAGVGSVEDLELWAMPSVASEYEPMCAGPKEPSVADHTARWLRAGLLIAGAGLREFAEAVVDLGTQVLLHEPQEVPVRTPARAPAPASWCTSGGQPAAATTLTRMAGYGRPLVEEERGVLEPLPSRQKEPLRVADALVRVVIPDFADVGRVLAVDRSSLAGQLSRDWAARHLAIPVYGHPSGDAGLVGEVPYGEVAQCLGRQVDYLRVRWGSLEGWIGPLSLAALRRLDGTCEQELPTGPETCGLLAPPAAAGPLPVSSPGGANAPGEPPPQLAPRRAPAVLAPPRGQDRRPSSAPRPPATRWVDASPPPKLAEDSRLRALPPPGPRPAPAGPWFSGAEVARGRAGGTAYPPRLMPPRRTRVF